MKTISYKKLKDLVNSIDEETSIIKTMIENKEDNQKICKKLLYVSAKISNTIVAPQSKEYKEDIVAEFLDIIDMY